MTGPLLAPGSDTRPLITVLGATGFIGSAVMARLARRPVRLRAVSRRPAVTPIAEPADVEVVTADLTDRAALRAAVEGSDAVIHAVLCEGGWRAAGRPDAEQVNVGIMRDLVEELRIRAVNTNPPPVLLYCGAASQVGVPPGEPLDGTEIDQPATTYDWQKMSAERMVMAATRAGFVRGISLRLPTVFGEGAAPGIVDRGVVAAMMRRAFAGEAITMWHDGTVRRDLVHVADIAAAFEAALEHPDELAGQHWLLGTGRGRELGEVLAMVARCVAERTGSDPVPVVSVAPPAHAPSTDFRSVTIDSTLFRTVTGWRPRIPLYAGIERLVAAQAWLPVHERVQATTR